MMRPRSIVARVWSLLHAQRLDRELDEEIQAHLDAATARYVAQGLTASAARLAARRDFGSVVQTKEAYREVRGIGLFDPLWRDIRYAARTLRKAPAFTCVAVMSLTLGVGATTAVFSVVDTVLLRPLPYASPDRLVIVAERSPDALDGFDDVAPANYADARRGARTLSDVAVWSATTLTWQTGDGAEEFNGTAVTGNIFALLGVTAAIGRPLLAADDDPATPRAIVISHQLWARRFGGDVTALNRSVELEGRPYTVVGVMPPGFRLPGGAGEFWIPLRLTGPARQQRSNHFLTCMGRLADGATIERARAELGTLAMSLQRAYPDTNAGITFDVQPIATAFTQRIRPALAVLFAVVVLMLVLACVNVASLSLTRAVSRQHELSVRAALGASAGRLMRQMATEVALLCAISAIGALGACRGLTTVLQAMLPMTLVPAGGFETDARVLVFGVSAAVIAAALSSLGPAAILLRRDLSESLASQSRGSTDSRSHVRTRRALVGCEVALAVVMLVGAGLLVRSFARVTRVEPGFQARDRFVVRFSLPDNRYTLQSRRLELYDRLVARTTQIRGVESAAVATCLPLTPCGGSSWFTRERRPSAHPEDLIANNRLVSDGYFRTLAIALRRGRPFETRDDAIHPLVAVINEAAAARFWPGDDPIGMRFKFGDEASTNPWITIVGVVGDVHQTSLETAPKPEIYRPFAQDDQRWLAARALVVRTSGDPSATEPAVRNALRSIDRGVPVTMVAPYETLLDESVSARHVMLVAVTGCAAIAWVLAWAGVFGIVAYAATRRRREMAVRLALGAAPASLVGLMVRQAAPAVLGGVVGGALVSIALTKGLQPLLFGVSALDASTYSGVSALMLAAGALAAYLPARRAGRADPVIALKHE